MIAMNLKKLKTNNNYLRMNILFLLLIISNIVLFIGLINHYSSIGVNVIHFKLFSDVTAAIATLIILGFVTLKLPKIIEFGDSSIYGSMYLIMICVIGLMTSYFGNKINISALFGPYLEMFNMLCAILIFILIASLLKSFKGILHEEYTKKNLIVCLIIFAVLGIVASKWSITVDNSPANVRCLVVMISGLIGGPFVGIPVAIISGLYRFTLGGTTALPCTISTVLSGVVGSLVFIWHDKKFPKTFTAIILMFLFTGFEMLLAVMLTPADISFPYVKNIYPIMLFSSVVGMTLVSILIMEEKQKTELTLSEEEREIEELKSKIKRHDEKIEELKNEIQKLKRE